MITITEKEVVGLDHAIRGMRNPMNSWLKSDSDWAGGEFYVGDADLNLAKKLSKAGTDHRKYLRFITVYCDIVAPLYWLKEMDTYRMGVEKNSCSTMHKIHSKEFDIGDFSIDKCNDIAIASMQVAVSVLNELREKYLETMNKAYWYSMIQILPSSYNQKRTYMFSYEALANIYHARKNHKLDEWRDFCRWIEELPYSELITGEEKNE